MTSYSETSKLAAPRGLRVSETDGPRHPLYLILKFLIEWMLAFVLVLLTSPLIFMLALLVKATSRGPAFYVQSRLGLRGRTFHIIKLRTMAHNSEATTGPVWSLPGDRRVTRIGRVLRDTHLDELPQLLNVLSGDMSLVGPRPERPEIAARIEQALPNFRHRLMLRPGVTGLAQMRLPADTDLRGVRLKLAHDLYYIQEVSFLLDLKIAFSTALYFLGAIAHASRDALMKSYGLAAEHSLAVLPEPEPDDCEVGAAKLS